MVIRISRIHSVRLQKPKFYSTHLGKPLIDMLVLDKVESTYLLGDFSTGSHCLLHLIRATKHYSSLALYVSPDATSQDSDGIGPWC